MLNCSSPGLGRRESWQSKNEGRRSNQGHGKWGSKLRPKGTRAETSLEARGPEGLEVGVHAAASSLLVSLGDVCFLAPPALAVPWSKREDSAEPKEDVVGPRGAA